MEAISKPAPSSANAEAENLKLSMHFKGVTKESSNAADRKYDYELGDTGNIVALDHINLVIPDQQSTIQFFVVGLGFTRDPYLRVGLDNMGITVGRSQFHLNTAGDGLFPQKLRGTIGFVVPDLEALPARLKKIAPYFDKAGIDFSYTVNQDSVGVKWAGNRFRCHAPAAEFGETDLAIAYVDLEVPRGTAQGIGRFYQEGLLARVKVTKQDGNDVAAVNIGPSRFLFRETDAPIPEFDGHHVAVYLTNHSAPYEFLKRHVIVVEDHAQQYRFRDIVDPQNGKQLFILEHEVRSLKHVRYGEALVNRNSAQNIRSPKRGQDAFHGRL